MLSIKALKLGDERYYLALALEDYYLQGGEPPGIWLGSGAKILGLTGNVTNEQLSNLFRGYSPDGQMTELVQNAGHPDRQPGWDLTLNVPKTVSVLWSTASEPIRAEIEAAVTSALKRTISYIEEHLARSRTGKGGADDVPARLVVAAFPHSTSRALDPHLHFHPLIMNVGVGPDARTRTVLSFVEYELGSGDWLARLKQSGFGRNAEFAKTRNGPIALQDYGSEVHFRNIKIRPIAAEGGNRTVK